ncbi:MAG: bifunctional D-glycero-beta-D-manno-heptose-7-phosphate kinase/D-glycero-beta-D-manno-heptose 1-phosphate adenylyltransferase HldE, partial [Proteobacteria bacterium]|nr:bifunctional D-glycero-beta-D-manno-heptose-7-phosphate kinase/D-glycero-beta-D-manno-heptose 1-phosphate adenylyltransferase HldE [Pseudomonadota bacterium]
GIRAELIGGVGRDGAGQTLRRLCADLNISADLICSETNRTTVKLRVISQHQQLLRLDFEADGAAYDNETLLKHFNDKLPDADIVVVSDYGKGFVSDCRSLINAAKAAGKRVVVDPKSNDFSNYSGAYLVTPNYLEFEACVGSCINEQDIIERGESLCRDHDIGALLITRGELGMILVSPHSESISLAAQARDVFDVTGAGDTVCAVVASALAAGEELHHAMIYANMAASIVVGKLGTASVTRAELDHGYAIRDEIAEETATLLNIFPEIMAARARGERIVMTNGCFDILHAGHVTYLTQAKALGTRLIVALNSDASVTRLKGAGRPVHRLEDRIRVMRALSVVDWVVSFDEDTPLNLIEKINPDVLVKGGDYKPDDIVGAAHVRESGGEVVVLPFVSGLSTSGIVAKLGAQST